MFSEGPRLLGSATMLSRRHHCHPLDELHFQLGVIKPFDMSQYFGNSQLFRFVALQDMEHNRIC
jgi:hypothetical protein